MKKVIALVSMFVFTIVFVASVSATGPIMKAHNDAAGKKGQPNGVKMTCAFCHGEKGKPKPAGAIEMKKQGLKKGEAKHATLKDNAICKSCHK